MTRPDRFDPQEALAALRRRHPRRIVTIDSHTAGEPTRLVLGCDDLPGAGMAEKRTHFMAHHDALRRLLTLEPRGHRELLAAVVTRPVTPGARFGLIYMDARRYPFLCGHATIGAVVSLMEAGCLAAGKSEEPLVIDTPSGAMRAQARIADGRASAVAIEMVPSFVAGTDLPLDVAGLGVIRVDLVCVGGFFVMVQAHQTGLALTPQNRPALTHLGMTIIEAANGQLKVRHPTRPEVGSVDVVEFYDDTGQTGNSVVIYGEAHMDRSPCGTGTAAKMTLAHYLGKLPLNQPFFNAGPLGTVFEGRLTGMTRLADQTAVKAEIVGSAYITGIHEFVLDPCDPFPQGFLL
jgi:proline racemase